MLSANLDPELTHQAQFHQQYGHLRDPHVRALAWLLSAPNLLEPAAPCWSGAIASLTEPETSIRSWLAQIDGAPSDLQFFIDEQKTARLGRYAERLMTFYFAHQHTLYVQNLQVQSERDTVGEFDFLLWCGKVLLHWEFATKFYLYVPGSPVPTLDRFVGPNLADALGAKLRKILTKQLALGRHPSAATYLPAPIEMAQVLIKGWLFYPLTTYLEPDSQQLGLNHQHCRGLWCLRHELDAWSGDAFFIMPRLEWLAPAKVCPTKVIDRIQLMQIIDSRFLIEESPILIARVEPVMGSYVETDRAFVTPNDWLLRATAEMRLARW